MDALKDETRELPTSNPISKQSTVKARSLQWIAIDSPREDQRRYALQSVAAWDLDGSEDGLRHRPVRTPLSLTPLSAIQLGLRESSHLVLAAAHVQYSYAKPLPSVAGLVSGQRKPVSCTNQCGDIC
eukprot:4375125-Amphidinium_carterae.2